jgi:hypothetical protein
MAASKRAVTRASPGERDTGFAVEGCWGEVC